MARRRRRSSRRRNPFFLGKKTAVGTSLSGRLVRSKSKRKRIGKSALLVWRKKNVKGRRRVKSLRANPWFLGKKTAVGTSISGRVIKSKKKGKRIGRKQLTTWRKKHVKGSYRVKSLLRGQKKSRRIRKNPSHHRSISARLAVLERKIKAMTKAMAKATRALKSARRRRLGAGR